MGTQGKRESIRQLLYNREKHKHGRILKGKRVFPVKPMEELH